MRGGSIDGPEIWDGIVCPTCFAALAEERDVVTHWRFIAEDIHLELETVTPEGRVWNDITQLWTEARNGRNQA